MVSYPVLESRIISHLRRQGMFTNPGMAGRECEADEHTSDPLEEPFPTRGSGSNTNSAFHFFRLLRNRTPKLYHSPNSHSQRGLDILDLTISMFQASRSMRHHSNTRWPCQTVYARQIGLQCGKPSGQAFVLESDLRTTIMFPSPCSSGFSMGKMVMVSINTAGLFLP
ncbi:hypothetical protein K402DRAFT_398570 [Aulographum hederae CBS 113979]|uniref:Uncharacterized protein n=1 Tax=Aulographum hederae CBS 113979 TaxID=1176131 RepID=A0A6G1GKK9_9PEZI|nr:hypothetical protein K402DRAFT_398570 [Aulographum hederae CBS 113979]